VCNLGDSRVLKVRLGHNPGLCEESGTGGGVTVDHKPSSYEEKRRIESCGAIVVTEPPYHTPRINRELALSRGLGDRRWKTTKNRDGETAVSAVPDVFRTQCRRNEFLVLISDGLVERERVAGFGNREVASEVARCLAEDPDDLAGAAEQVCKRAGEAGSKDNLTCVILKPRFTVAEGR
jgi:serine/threonine protein phosphatase PrpC